MSCARVIFTTFPDGSMKTTSPCSNEQRHWRRRNDTLQRLQEADERERHHLPRLYAQSWVPPARDTEQVVGRRAHGFAQEHLGRRPCVPVWSEKCYGQRRLHAGRWYHQKREVIVMYEFERHPKYRAVRRFVEGALTDWVHIRQLSTYQREMMLDEDTAHRAVKALFQEAKKYR